MWAPSPGQELLHDGRVDNRQDGRSAHLQQRVQFLICRKMAFSREASAAKWIFPVVVHNVRDHLAHALRVRRQFRYAWRGSSLLKHTGNKRQGWERCSSQTHSETGHGADRTTLHVPHKIRCSAGSLGHNASACRMSHHTPGWSTTVAAVIAGPEGTLSFWTCGRKARQKIRCLVQLRAAQSLKRRFHALSIDRGLHAHSFDWRPHRVSVGLGSPAGGQKLSGAEKAHRVQIGFDRLKDSLWRAPSWRQEGVLKVIDHPLRERLRLAVPGRKSSQTRQERARDRPRRTEAPLFFGGRGRREVRFQ